MAEPITIDIILTAKNRTQSGVKEVARGLDTLAQSASKAKRGLDDTERGSRQVQRTLREMAREKVMILLEAKDQLTPVLDQAKSGLKGMAGKAWTVTLKTADFVTRPVRGLLNLLTSVQGMIFGAAGAFGGLVAPMDISGDYEQTEIAFSTMLKSAEKARQFLAEASDFANATPFEFPDLIDSSRLLLAFGFDPDSILPMMTVIGDASSGLGAGAQGIDRITRALGQMKAKGRVLTEELMQLQEVGIPVNQILQEELGLTQEQVADIGDENVAAEDAIAGLLRGMEKRYGGMMENQSKTAKGLMSTISDTFQNTFMRSWGTGLWAGFKPGLEKITGWLDENPDKVEGLADRLEELGRSFSSSMMDHVEKVQRSVEDLINDPMWRQADFFGKLEIAWDRLIGAPLSEWWNSQGKQKVSGLAEDMGEFIGTGLNRGIMALFGISDSGILQDGMSAGTSFMNGFLEGLEPGKIKEAVLDKLKDVFSDSVFGGGNSPTTWLSTLLVGGMGIKGLGAGMQVGKGVYQTYSAAKILSGLFHPGVATAGASQGGTGAVAAAAGGLSLPVMASLAGGILGAMGLNTAIKDLKRAGNADLSWERDRYTRQGLTKGWLVTGGAAAGAAIGSIIPGAGTLAGGLVGAGVGGLTALVGGNKISDQFKTERERVHESLMEIGDDMEAAVESYNETFSKTELGRGLIDEYEELKNYMNSADFDHSKAEEVQKRMKQLTQDLQSLFPGLISSYETINGLSSAHLNTLEQEMNLEERKATRELKLAIQNTREQIPQMEADYQEIEEAIQKKQGEFSSQFAYRRDLAFAYEAYRNAFDQEGLSSADEDRIYGNFINDANAAARAYGLGENAFANEGQVQSELERLADETNETNREINGLLEQQAEIEAQIAQYYESSVEAFQRELGVDLSEASEQIQAMQGVYDSLESGEGLTDEMRQLVEEILPGFSEAETATDKMDLLARGISDTKEQTQGVLSKIKELNESLSLLPDEKKIQISVTGNAGFLAAPSVFGGMNPDKNATGGFVNGPRLSWIGEDGPEAIIQMSGKYRSRGLELYEQAGKYLGIGYQAEGGAYAPAGNTQGTTASKVAFHGMDASGTAGGITIQIDAPQVQIQQGNSLQETMERFRQEWAGMGDQLLAELARRIVTASENMPGGAT